MSLTIIDYETDEEVAEITDDGTIRADEPIDEENIANALGPNREAPYRHTSVQGDEEDDEVTIDEEVTPIKPGEKGYLAVVSECLPHPYGVDWENTDTDALEDPEVNNDEEDA